MFTPAQHLSALAYRNGCACSQLPGSRPSAPSPTHHGGPMRTVGFRIGIVLLAATLAACDRMADRSPTQTGPRQAASGQRHLARGVPIPPGQAVDALPEPYDPARDGAPGRNPILPDPAFNPHRPQPRSIPSGTDRGGAADVTPGNGDRGWFLYFSYQASGGVCV